MNISKSVASSVDHVIARLAAQERPTVTDLLLIPTEGGAPAVTEAQRKQLRSIFSEVPNENRDVVKWLLGPGAPAPAGVSPTAAGEWFAAAEKSSQAPRALLIGGDGSEALTVAQHQARNVVISEAEGTLFENLKATVNAWKGDVSAMWGLGDGVQLFAVLTAGEDKFVLTQDAFAAFKQKLNFTGLS